MNANEMSNALKEGLDVITNYSTPGLTDQEIGTILTSSEFYLVKNRLPNPEKPGLKVDMNELIKRELSTLYKNLSLDRATYLSADQSNVFPDGEYWDLPTDCYHLISESAIVSSSESCLNGELINVEPQEYDKFNSNRKNPFRNPDKSLIWSLIGTSGKQQLIKPVIFTEITNYVVSYIMKPQGIVPYDVSTSDGTTNAITNSLLPDITHQEIVDIAIVKAQVQLGLLQQAQAQAQLNELNK